MLKLESLLEKKDQEIESLKIRFGQLECEQDELQQYSRRNSIRISGLPETTQEDQVERLLDTFHNRMTLPMKLEDIDRAHRMGETDRRKNTDSSPQTKVNLNSTDILCSPVCYVSVFQHKDRVEEGSRLIPTVLEPP